MRKSQYKQILCFSLILLFLSISLSLYFSFSIFKIRTDNNPFSSNTPGTEIRNVTFTPSHPEWYDNITITAEITDPNGIYEVWINYAATKDQYAGWGANFTMTHLSDDLYSYTIYNSIWDPPWGPAHGASVNFTIFARNGLGQWSQSRYYRFYMNDTVAPVAQILTLTSNSYVSGVVEINTTIIEEGSGVKVANLSIYMGNGTVFKTFSTTQLNETFIWDVSSLPDYNISDPASYYDINFTVWDKATPANWNSVLIESVRIDNTAPYIAFINSYKTLSANALDNTTITPNPINATNFINDIAVTYFDNSTYHSFYNGSTGYLQVAYGFNFSNWNITSDMIESVIVTLDGKIGYSNSSILQAGWKIWNWVHQNFTIIDSTVFNSTVDISDSFSLTITNKTSYIKDLFDSRLEIFFFVSTTGPSINASIDYIVYNVTYYEIDEWYNRNNENITLKIIGDDLISFDRIELHYLNYTYLTLYSSGSHILSFNTTVLPDGTVPLNITVYDKAGNTNTSRILIDVDYFGPVVTIISPSNNSYIGTSGILDLIVPIRFSGYDVAQNFQRMELWINGELAPVLPGQLGQILEYDQFGQIIYEQSNATWYEEGEYTYYWNASNLPHNSTHTLQLRSFDGFDNPNSYEIFVTMATFKTNISITDVRKNYSTFSDSAIILEFKITNHGNSTLMDFTPEITLPSSWDWNFKNVDSFSFNYLNPGQSLVFQIQVIPRAIHTPINQTVQLTINCRIVENLTQISNNFSIQFQTHILVDPKSNWLDIQSTIFLLISIAAGLGIGLLSFYIFQYLRRVSQKITKVPEKEKKRK